MELNYKLTHKHCSHIWIFHQYTGSKRTLKFHRSFDKWQTHREAEHHICHGPLVELPCLRKHRLEGFILFHMNTVLTEWWNLGHIREKWSLSCTWISKAKKQGTDLSEIPHTDYFIKGTVYWKFKKWKLLYEISLSNISPWNKWKISIDQYYMGLEPTRFSIKSFILSSERKLKVWLQRHYEMMEQNIYFGGLF